MFTTGSWRLGGGFAGVNGLHGYWEDKINAPLLMLFISICPNHPQRDCEPKPLRGEGSSRFRRVSHTACEVQLSGRMCSVTSCTTSTSGHLGEDCRTLQFHVLRLVEHLHLF